MTVLVVGKIVNGVKITKFVQNGEVEVSVTQMPVREKVKVVKVSSIAEILKQRAAKFTSEIEADLNIPTFMKERSLRLKDERRVREQNKIVQFSMNG